jgi:hypothetical protein
MSIALDFVRQETAETLELLGAGHIAHGTHIDAVQHQFHRQTP